MAPFERAGSPLPPPPPLPPHVVASAHVQREGVPWYRKNSWLTAMVAAIFFAGPIFAIPVLRLLLTGPISFPRWAEVALEHQGIGTILCGVGDGSLDVERMGVCPRPLAIKNAQARDAVQAAFIPWAGCLIGKTPTPTPKPPDALIRCFANVSGKARCTECMQEFLARNRNDHDSQGSRGTRGASSMPCSTAVDHRIA